MMNEVESRLKEILSARGLKQKWLAEQVGISTSAMSQIVRGNNHPELVTALKIASTLKMPVEHIWILKK